MVSRATVSHAPGIVTRPKQTSQYNTVGCVAVSANRTSGNRRLASSASRMAARCRRSATDVQRQQVRGQTRADPHIVLAANLSEGTRQSDMNQYPLTVTRRRSPQLCQLSDNLVRIERHRGRRLAAVHQLRDGAHHLEIQRFPAFRHVRWSAIVCVQGRLWHVDAALYDALAVPHKLERCG